VYDDTRLWEFNWPASLFYAASRTASLAVRYYLLPKNI